MSEPVIVQPTPRNDNRRRAVIGVAALAVLAGVVAAILLRSTGDDGAPVSTTSTMGGSTSTIPVTSTTGRAGTISVDEAATVVWPDPGGTRRFSDPVEAARSFAVDLVGFHDPTLGSFRQGDSRSGEVEVRAGRAIAVTTVLVRRLSDDSWWVLGAGSDDIRLDEPIAGGAIDNPLHLVGAARGYEGTVQVSVFGRQSTKPLGEGFVTGSAGTELGPFDGTVTWANPGGGRGSVVLYEISAEDGSVVEASAIPVGFIGGD